MTVKSEHERPCRAPYLAWLFSRRNHRFDSRPRLWGGVGAVPGPVLVCCAMPTYVGRASSLSSRVVH